MLTVNKDDYKVRFNFSHGIHISTGTIIWYADINSICSHYPEWENWRIASIEAATAIVLGRSAATCRGVYTLTTNNKMRSFNGK